MSASTAARSDGRSSRRNRTAAWVAWPGGIALTVGLVLKFWGWRSDCGAPFAPAFDVRHVDAVAGLGEASGCLERLSGPLAAAEAFTLAGVVLIMVGIVLTAVLNQDCAPREVVVPQPSVNG